MHICEHKCLLGRHLAVFGQTATVVAHRWILAAVAGRFPVIIRKVCFIFSLFEALSPGPVIRRNSLMIGCRFGRSDQRLQAFLSSVGCCAAGFVTGTASRIAKRSNGSRDVWIWHNHLLHVARKTDFRFQNYRCVPLRDSARTASAGTTARSQDWSNGIRIC